MTSALPRNITNADSERYRTILRSWARLALGAVLLAGTAACSRIQHVETAPVGAFADAMPGAERKGAAPVPVVDIFTLVSDMKRGGYVVVFRHAPTNRDQADTDPLDYSDTAHQRLLSDKGKEIAKQVGDAFRTLGIPIGEIYTSRYDRAVETGRLISGTDVMTTLDVTEGGLVATPIENDRRAAALKRLVESEPDSGKNTIIVTHKPNLVDAFGAEWVSSRDAEASVFKPDGSGQPVLVARVQAADWIKAANGRDFQ
jgi:phosphohistidine phosphatase SixA